MRYCLVTGHLKRHMGLAHCMSPLYSVCWTHVAPEPYLHLIRVMLS
jgi:hypothetical protein